jgi:hypothetical protein
MLTVLPMVCSGVIYLTQENVSGRTFPARWGVAEGKDFREIR